MALPEIANLSETDIKILVNLITRQTMSELAFTSGIKPAYLQKRVARLKAKGYIKQDGYKGNIPLYQTVRVGETQLLFEMREGSIADTTTGLYQIPEFYGRTMPVMEAYAEIRTTRVKLKDKNLNLGSAIGILLGALVTRSYKMSTGETVAIPPNEKELRAAFIEIVQQTKKELRLAELILEDGVFWRGSPDFWKLITKEPEGFEPAWKASIKRLRKGRK